MEGKLEFVARCDKFQNDIFLLRKKCDIRCGDDIFAYANMIYFAKGKICRGLRPAFYLYNQNAQRFPSCFATAKYIIFSLAKIYHKPLAYIILQSNISLFQFIAAR